MSCQHVTEVLIRCHSLALYVACRNVYKTIVASPALLSMFTHPDPNLTFFMLYNTVLYVFLTLKNA